MSAAGAVAASLRSVISKAEELAVAFEATEQVAAALSEADVDAPLVANLHTAAEDMSRENASIENLAELLQRTRAVINEGHCRTA